MAIFRETVQADLWRDYVRYELTRLLQNAGVVGMGVNGVVGRDFWPFFDHKTMLPWREIEKAVTEEQSRRDISDRFLIPVVEQVKKFGLQGLYQ